MNFDSGFQQNFTTNTQTIAEINFSILDVAPQNIPYLNFTFKNETVAKEDTTAQITASTWTYFLGSGTVNKTLSFSTTTEAETYSFALSPQNRTLLTDVSLNYDNAESQQRTYEPSRLTLTNDTTNTTLFLLPTSDGIFVTFQVINPAEQPIANAEVILSNADGTISTTKTSSSGTTAVFLNPDNTYTLTINAVGFTSFTTTQTFPTSEFTIRLGDTGAAGQDYLRGISVITLPIVQALQNNTEYNFSLELGSTFWSLDSFGYVISNGSGTELASQTSTSGTGGLLSDIIDTGNESKIVMEYFWEINDSYNNRTVTWAVRENIPGSLEGFFNRLNTYIGQGIFGITPWGVMIITFAIVFMTVSILSFKFGIFSPIPLISIGTLFVILFETVGLIPAFPVGTSGRTIPYVGSTIMVIILTSLIWREV